MGNAFEIIFQSDNRDVVHTKSSSKLQRRDRLGLMRLTVSERSWKFGGIWACRFRLRIRQLQRWMIAVGTYP